MASDANSEVGPDDGSSRSPVMLPAGTLLRDEYRIEEVLGMGTFGITYRARDENLATDVAIKEYYPRHVASRVGETLQVRPHSSAESEDFEYGLRQFREEGRTVARFDHPNVVDVRSFVEENGTGYLVMDYYEGQSLAEYLDESSGRLPEGEAIGLLLKIFNGLQQVHEAGVLHRAIDPQNIYRTREGEPLLIDFGAARQAVVARRQDLSEIVKPGYAPIEQYSADGDQDVRTDLYACAATLYRCLTGTKPPPAPERVQEDQLEPPEQVRPEISSDTSLAVRKGLAVYPEQRPQSAQAFADLLRTSASVSEELEPSPPTETQTASPPDTAPSEAVPTQLRDDDGPETEWGALSYALVGAGLLAAVAGIVLYSFSTTLLDASADPELGPRSVAVLPFTYLS